MSRPVVWFSVASPNRAIGIGFFVARDPNDRTICAVLQFCRWWIAFGPHYAAHNSSIVWPRP